MFINFVLYLFEGKFSNFREEIPGDIFLCFPSLSFFVKVIKLNGGTEQKCWKFFFQIFSYELASTLGIFGGIGAG